jgi:membrane fusion protein (multidrug efflux system)
MNSAAAAELERPAPAELGTPAPAERELPRLAPVPRRRRLSRSQLALGTVAVAALAGAAWYGHDWWTAGRFIDSTDDAYVGADVTVIAPNVAGFIVRVAVTDNQEVKKGDLLATIDDRDYRAGLARAAAAVDGQRATLANLDATRRLQQAMIAQAVAEVSAVDAEVIRARDDQARFRMLAASSAGTIQASEHADADYKKAVAAGERARAALSAAQRQIDVIATRAQQARAALAGAVAERDRAQLDVGYTELRAPIDGTVGKRSARAGAFAPVGAQLMAIVPAQGLWVDANFKETQLARMRPGQPVTIAADVLPGQRFHGRVVSLAPATGAQFSILPAENATGNFTKIVQRVPVRIVLDGDGGGLGRLRPGLSVTAEVDERPVAIATASAP